MTHRQLLNFSNVRHVRVYKTTEYERSTSHLCLDMNFLNSKIKHRLASNPRPFANRKKLLCAKVYGIRSRVQYHRSVSTESIFLTSSKVGPVRSYREKSIFGAPWNRTHDPKGPFPFFSRVWPTWPTRKKIRERAVITAFVSNAYEMCSMCNCLF